MESIYKKISYTFLFLIAGFFTSSAQTTNPVLTEIVTDSAKIFSYDELLSLRKKLTLFEKETTNQIVVLTINSLEGKILESHAYEVFNQNKLGQKDTDNGALILFAKEDRKVRIEVGDGLEPYLTDAFSSRIIRNIMIPEFKNENYSRGIALGTDKILELLNDPEARAEFNQQIENESKSPFYIKIIFTLFISIFTLFGGYLFYKFYAVLIEVFRGIFIGKLGIGRSLMLIFSSTFSLALTLPFVFMPLMGILFINEVDTTYFKFLTTNITLTAIVLFGILFGLAIILAIIKIRIKGKENFKISLFETDAKYFSKTFSSNGSHAISSGSSGSRSSSSSSFSGGGGSSSGGGASGSW